MIWLAFFVSIIKKNSKNSYFVLVPKSYQILSNNLEKNIRYTQEYNNGSDFRFQTTNDWNETTFVNIKNNLHKLHVLNLLQNTSVNHMEKIKHIEKYENDDRNKSRFCYDICAGGLLDDFF